MLILNALKDAKGCFLVVIIASRYAFNHVNRVQKLVKISVLIDNVRECVVNHVSLVKNHVNGLVSTIGAI